MEKVTDDLNNQLTQFIDNGLNNSRFPWKDFVLKVDKLNEEERKKIKSLLNEKLLDRNLRSEKSKYARAILLDDQFQLLSDIKNWKLY